MTDTTESNQTIRDFAVAIPGATRLFERIGLDYCCGGAMPLDEACAERGLDASEVRAALESLGRQDRVSSDDPATWSLSALVDYIVAKHHVFTRDELERLDLLFDKVCAAHGARHPELVEMRGVFHELTADLVPHMLKEEQVLFPYVKCLEAAARSGDRMRPPFFGTVRNPVRMMQLEHDSAGTLLARLRALGSAYLAPEDACMSFRTLYGALADLEADLHQHIHLENNILFPRAVALESGL